MYKGQKTRESILREAFLTFNEKGYAAASMTDLMSATGLTKGGIYNHFQSKEELTSEAFNYAVETISKELKERVEQAANKEEKLLVIINHFTSGGYGNPLFAGGCPLMNAAIESDCGYPVLKSACADAFQRFVKIVREVLVEFSPDELADTPEQTALFIVSTLEGALMLSQITGSNQPLLVAAETLRKLYKI